MTDYDLVVIGAGCAGLALGAELARWGQAAPAACVLDARDRYENDRTWCFWSAPDDPWLRAARASWPAWAVGRLGRTPVVQRSSKFRYTCLPSIDYYRLQQRTIQAHPGVDLHLGTRVGGVEFRRGQFRVATDSGELTARQVVDTRPDRNVRPILWQQFEGLEIRTSSACFDSASAGLMLDMHCDEYGFVFTYVLPFAADHALVEVTRFTVEPLPERQLKRDSRQTLEQRAGQAQIEVLRHETGLLPMGWWPDPPGKERQPVRAGAGAGALRSSSGYGFARMQSWARRCARSIVDGGGAFGHPAEPAWRRLMDRRFLQVIRREPRLAPQLFERIGERLDADRFVRFMSDGASWSDTAMMIAALPMRPFLLPLSGRQRRHFHAGA